MTVVVNTYQISATNHRNCFIKVINYRYLTGTVITLSPEINLVIWKNFGLLFLKFNFPSCHLNVLWRPVKKGISTETTSKISTNMLHTSLSTDSEILICSDLPGILTEPYLVTLTTGDSIIALTSYDKSDITYLHAIKGKCEASNLMKSSGTGSWNHSQ